MCLNTPSKPKTRISTIPTGLADFSPYTLHCSLLLFHSFPLHTTLCAVRHGWTIHIRRMQTGKHIPTVPRAVPSAAHTHWVHALHRVLGTHIAGPLVPLPKSGRGGTEAMPRAGKGGCPAHGCGSQIVPASPGREWDAWGAPLPWGAAWMG